MLCLLVAALVASAGGDELAGGVVIETVAPNSGGATSGLREGDVILHWSRGDRSGQVDSPFDLTGVEVEEAPQGAVTLQGRTGADMRSWILRADTWGIKARPNFSGALLQAFREGNERLASGKATEAMGLWRAVGHDSPPWLRAWLVLRAADVLAGAKQWNDADAAYRESAEQGELAGPPVSAQILRTWGKTLLDRSSWEQAEQVCQRSLAEERRLGLSTLGVAQSTHYLGVLCFRRGDLACAEDYFSRALDIREKNAPDSTVVSASLNAMGVMALQRGDLSRAEEYLDRSLEILEKLNPDSADVATRLINVGVIAVDRGDLARAAGYYQRAIALLERVAPDRESLILTLVNMGGIAARQGDLAAYESYLLRAGAANRKTSSERAAVLILNGLGVLAGERGDVLAADHYFRHAIEIEERLQPGSLDLALFLGNLGLSAVRRGDLAAAGDLLRRAAVIVEEQAPGSGRRCKTLLDLSVLAREQGDLERAESYSRQALAVAEKIGDSLEAANVLNDLGETAQKQGRLAQAEEWYRRALSVRERLVPGTLYHGESLAAVGAVIARKHEWNEAAGLLDQGLAILEDQVVRQGGSDDARTTLRSGRANYYRAYIDVLMAQKEGERAFHVAERSRARTLLETLAEAHVDIRQGIDPDLLQRERSLRADIAAKSNRQIQLISGTYTEAQIAAVKREIADLLTQYREVEAQIRATGSSYAALTQPQPLTAREVQQQVLDRDTVLLEYALGDEQSYLWAVGSDSLRSYELPKRAEIEAVARRFYELVTARSRFVEGEDAFARRERIARADADLPSAARAVSQLVLEPAAAQIGGKRLLVVPDGILHYIPFAALPNPRRPGSDANWPLVAQHEVLSLPSASVLGLLRRARGDRPPAAKEIAVLADPVFDEHDGRVRAGRLSGEHGAQAEGKARGDDTVEVEVASSRLGVLRRAEADASPSSGRVHLPRLPFTRDEARAILTAVNGRRSMEALDFDATRELAVSGQLEPYRVVHFATHAFVDSVHPELSGLVLSMVDKGGRSQDGFLELQDIYNMSLEADLVVLSACQTALGQQVEGEGIVGLTRGFMHAGAPRVVATLWQVDDSATARLMAHFYKAFEQDHLPAAQALRAAQLALSRESRWSAPYYWAAFTLQGDWR
jgi:CHAT domain-containing protein/Tfp pilus assembly protein PilF